MVDRSESEFFQRVKLATPTAQWVRIENVVSSGIFDNLLHERKTMAWVEMKLKRTNDPDDGWLRASQKIWGRKSLKLCPNLFVMQYDQRTEQVNVFHLINPSMMPLDQEVRVIEKDKPKQLFRALDAVLVRCRCWGIV